MNGSASSPASAHAGPLRLRAELHPNVWGEEIWFLAPTPHSILVKHIRTRDRLSVQVHPSGANGKTEMWHIAACTPDAEIALGLNTTVTKDGLRRTAETGDIEALLNRVRPAAGASYFVPAGTIHALGGGLELWEIQQFSTITYRLYDYRRQPPRELHLDAAVEVALCTQQEAAAVDLPIACEYFQTHALNVDGRITHVPAAQELLVAMDGSGSIAGEPFSAGEVWALPSTAPVQIDGRARFLRTYVP